MKEDEWSLLCESMEGNYEPVHDFMETWGRHCGAPRAVFLGHLCKMLIKCGVKADGMTPKDDVIFNRQWDVA